MGELAVRSRPDGGINAAALPTGFAAGFKRLLSIPVSGSRLWRADQAAIYQHSRTFMEMKGQVKDINSQLYDGCLCGPWRAVIGPTPSQIVRLAGPATDAAAEALWHLL